MSGILPEDIEMSEDALEIPDDELDVEMQEEEDIQLESLELSELDEPAVTEEAALVDNEEGQTAPGQVNLHLRAQMILKLSMAFW